MTKSKSEGETDTSTIGSEIQTKPSDSPIHHVRNLFFFGKIPFIAWLISINYERNFHDEWRDRDRKLFAPDLDLRFSDLQRFAFDGKLASKSATSVSLPFPLCLLLLRLMLCLLLKFVSCFVIVVVSFWYFSTHLLFYGDGESSRVGIGGTRYFGRNKKRHWLHNLSENEPYGSLRTPHVE